MGWRFRIGRRATLGLLAISSAALISAPGGATLAQAPAAIPPEPLNWSGDPSAPSFSGVWVLNQNDAKAGTSKEGWRPWPAPLKGAFAGKRLDDPIARCLPAGMPRFITAAKGPLLIIQQHGRVMMYRSDEGPRRIWLDGRTLPAPADTEPFFKGVATGHYEGSDLVVESIGFKDGPIDSTGVPHSHQLKIVERYHRVNDDTLTVEVTLTDPEAYKQPMSTTVRYRRQADPQWEPREFICNPQTNYAPDRYVG